ncbi:MAG: SOS response-associated peptidase [Flavobacteriales bacterium]
MCYDIDTIVYRAVKHAKSKGFGSGAIDEMVRELLEQWYGPEHFHASGFDHPEVVCVTNEHGLSLEKMRWGLVPAWIKSAEEASKIRNQTLIARAESIFEKPSFREAAHKRRCLLPLGGFYEHYHKNKKTFPHHIARKDGDVLIIAGIWENGLNPETAQIEKTMAIVTTEANAMMKEIHNNPKAAGPRMPVILDAVAQRIWLDPGADENELCKLMMPAPEELLESYTVRPLRGAKAVGDQAEASEPYHYPELDEPLTLF